MMLAGCWMPWFKNYCCVAPCWGRPWHLQILIDACSIKIDLLYFCYVFLFSRSGTFNMKEPDRSSYDICSQQSIRTPGEYIFGSNLSHEVIAAPVQVKNDKFFVQFFLLFLSWFLICCLSTKKPVGSEWLSKSSREIRLETLDFSIDATLSSTTMD